MSTSNENSSNSERTNQASSVQESQKNGPRKMTTEEYVRENQADLNYSADVYWRDDKEGDFAHKGIAAIIAIDQSSDDSETQLVDYHSKVRDEMKNDKNHPITKMIWRKPKRK